MSSELLDFYHNLAYKELAVEHLDEEKILTFEYKGNRIASFDSVQQPCISVETEHLVYLIAKEIYANFTLIFS